MARFDRYLLSQLVMLFGFFALVLVSIYWINSAVRLFDRLIGDGQSAWVVIEFTALSLPNVIRITMPMAVFAAAVFVTNRLSSDSELVVMQATGFSPWRLARPVLVFGLLTGALMLVMTHFLVPASKAQTEVRTDEVAQNITARLLTEGTFLHPARGITFYIREITPDGALHDIFFSDRRDPAQPQTFTASTAYIVNAAAGNPEADPEPRLVMIDGLSQTLNAENGRLFTTHFQNFSYDISALLNNSRGLNRPVETLPTPMLLFTPGLAATVSGDSPGEIAYELNIRFQQALLCVVSALIGFAALLVGGFSRFGVWRQIVFAVVLLVVVKALESMVGEPVLDDPSRWPLIYVSPLAGFGIAAGLLWWAGRPKRPRATPEPVGGVPA